MTEPNKSFMCSVVNYLGLEQAVFHIRVRINVTR